MTCIWEVMCIGQGVYEQRDLKQMGHKTRDMCVLLALLTLVPLLADTVLGVCPANNVPGTVTIVASSK
jgi:hypothetical protein